MWKGRQLFSQAAVGGSRGDGDRCGSPSRGGSEKAGFGTVPRLEAAPASPPSQIPGRGRAGAGSGGGSGRRQCDFTRSLGLGFLDRVDELWGFEGLPEKLRWPEGEANTFLLKHTQKKIFGEKIPQVTQPAREVE